MSGGPLRPMILRGDAAARGAAHGARLAGAIREYTEERVRLACDGSWAGRRATRAELLALAERMLPAHQAYAPELYTDCLLYTSDAADE